MKRAARTEIHLRFEWATLTCSRLKKWRCLLGLWRDPQGDRLSRDKTSGIIPQKLDRVKLMACGSSCSSV
ncbi:hypothetical protein MHYP_G00255010 [Metynnis hypsauchen]